MSKEEADGDIIMTDSTSQVLDEKLYNRQLYVMGHEAMLKMQKSHVLLVGLNGLGVEIAKNIILAGVKSLSILDKTPTKLNDLSSQFYLSEGHVGKSRASSCLQSLKELNPYVAVNLIEDDLSPLLISSKKYQVVVLINLPLSVQITYNQLCRDNGIKFISAEALGVFGSVFIDFGNSFIVNDPDGENPASGLLTHITKSNPCIITVHEDNRHGLQTGDFVTFNEIEGMDELNAMAPVSVKVINPYSFEIPVDTSGFKDYIGEGVFTQVKQPKELSFKSLEDQLKKPDIVLTDFTKDPTQHHIFYQALSQYRSQHENVFPQPDISSGAEEVVGIAKKLAGDTQIDEKKFWRLARCSSAVINPIAAFLGGVVGQEILKACTGKFTPIHQFLYFDAAEALCEDTLPLSEYTPLGSRYDDNIAVFGRELQQKVQNSKLFLVGAGAIGCEMLKNWALIGLGCGEGQIFVTDMDNIETSNLNRQFLFRSKDVGQPKSSTAAAAVRAMNADIKISSQLNRVGPETEEIFTADFWQNLTAVCTALDNIDARLYVDAQCVNYKKPLLESGTLGTKGNTQIVVPFLTESYGSTRDPPEKDIPICTLKNFPNKIEHTIQWARDDFEGTFKQGSDDVNQYLSKSSYLQELAKNSSSELSTLRRIKEYLIESRPKKFDDCVAWARNKFEKEYCHRIKQLLHNFPKDATTKEGNKFWSGPKRAPEPIEFDPKDPLHMNYIISASNLRASVYGLKGTADQNTIINILNTIVIPPFQPENVKIATTDEEAKDMKDNPTYNDYDQEINSLRKSLPDPKTLSGYRLTSVEFEKDDDTNFHMDYITSASNLRARNYKIKEANKHETKGIAGKIIPAIATTTALVTGLILLEYYKILQLSTKKIEDYRNAYVNLAIPLFTMSEPVPVPKKTIKLKDRDWSYSLWDKIEIDNDITLSELINYFEINYGLNLSMLSHGSAILHAFFHPPSKQKQREKMKLSDLVESVTKKPLSKDKKHLLFEVGLTNDKDEDIEVPTVRVRVR